MQVLPDVPCWKEWERTYLDFYYSNQKHSVGQIINNAGYKVMQIVQMPGKRDHTTIKPDKIVCWEHPNLGDAILQAMDAHFRKVTLNFGPLIVPTFDLNLVVRFVYQK